MRFLARVMLAFVGIFSANLPLPLQALTLDDFGESHAMRVQFGEESLSAYLAGASVGGGRTLAEEALSGGVGRACALTVGEGVLSHSQDAYATSRARIIWDGDSDPTTLSSQGLGSLDLLQDGGTALQIKIASFDFPAGQPAPLTITLFDGEDPSGQRYSTAALTLTAPVVTPTSFSVPFSSFTPGPNGPADLRAVGAIALDIDGSQVPALDLAIDAIGTNGSCAAIPGENGSVFDVCGVCGGDGLSCLDCAGVPFGNAKLDVCGLCAGDGTSCLDCAGVPKGTAVLDRCGVCAGDGQSCLGCEESDQESLIITMDGDSKEQEGLVRLILSRVKQRRNDVRTREFVASRLQKARELHLKNWTLSWSLPVVHRRCAHATYCKDVSTTAITTEYRLRSRELRNLAIEGAKMLETLTGKSQRAMVRRAERLYSRSIKVAAAVPAYQSVCS